MEYLVRFVQLHETFRQPEADSLAELHGLDIEWVSYSLDSPYAVIRFPGSTDGIRAAKNLAQRSILIQHIYELWGIGPDHAALHEDIHKRTEHLWPDFKHSSFRFELESYQASRTSSEQRAIFESLEFMGFRGRIQMKNPDHQFTVFEESDHGGKHPKRVLFGRLIASGDRRAIVNYNVKKRKYISTTTMDAELSLVTANLAQAGPGRLAYDPFMGTGSFPLACAYYGSCVLGSDMDGRSIRGKKDRSVKANFEQYGTVSRYLDGFAADITNTPIRVQRCLDSIVCDPPYGVREGLKVLGSTRVALHQEVFLKDGTPAHLGANYVPPKKPYSFLRMIDDILDFSSSMLVDSGRLSMWMPVAGAPEKIADLDDDEVPEEEGPVEEYSIPRHPGLALVSQCRQDFNKWSRRLLTYRRLTDNEVDSDALAEYRLQRLQLDSLPMDGKSTADDLNDFRRKYFQGFRAPS